MDQFWMEPPVGDFDGGDIVVLHLSTTSSIDDASVLFGTVSVPIESMTAGQGAISVRTPRYDGSGTEIRPGVFRQRVSVALRDGTDIDNGPAFVYIDDTATGVPAARQAPGTAERRLILLPALGRDEGGYEIEMISPSLLGPNHRDHSRWTVLFGSTPGSVNGVDIASRRIRVTVPPLGSAIANPFDVRVALKWQDSEIGEGVFSYHPKPVADGRDIEPVAAIVAIGLLLSAQLYGSLRRLQRRMAAIVPSALLDPALQNADRDERASHFEELRHLLESHHQATDGALRALSNAVAALQGRLPFQDFRLEDAVAKTVEARAEVRQRLRQDPRPDTESGPAQVRKSAPGQADEKASAFGAVRLAELWNGVRLSAGSTVQLIDKLNAAWPELVRARDDEGLIVVTSTNEASSWVLPSIQPLVHEATIQEFFDVRPSRDGVMRLVRPAQVPKGTDPHGFTAGQITRGVLEA